MPRKLGHWTWKIGGHVFISNFKFPMPSGNYEIPNAQEIVNWKSEDLYLSPISNFQLQFPMSSGNDKFPNAHYIGKWKLGMAMEIGHGKVEGTYSSPIFNLQFL